MKVARNTDKTSLIVCGTFFAARLILLLSLPLQGVQSYGDFWNFFNLAGLGRPFRDIWVEFPPLFPFLSRGLYILSSGKEHTYIYLSVLLFSLIQAGSVYLFQRIAEDIWGEDQGLRRTITYAFLVIGLFYGWAYFDCLAVFLMLLGLYLIIKTKIIAPGIVLGVGGLVKWFPVLVLPAAWKWIGAKKALKMLLSSLMVILIVWGTLYLISPEMTKASLISQGAKGSWESIWAILDGNFGTGNFGSAINHRDPATANLSTGNPSFISPWLTLIAFAALGGFLFWKANIQTELQFIAFSGLTLVLFFLWSPGYSPQWVLYLLPLVLLCFQGSRKILVAMLVLLINLAEWPLLLSRGLFEYLPTLIILRSVIYGLVAVMFAGLVLNPGNKVKES